MVNPKTGILIQYDQFLKQGVTLPRSEGVNLPRSQWVSLPRKGGISLRGISKHIQRPDGNNTPAFGTQLTFTPNSKFVLNYSTFIGNDKPDSLKRMRYFHNLYGMVHFSDKLHVTVGFDYGIEQQAKGSSDYFSWYSPVAIIMYNINDRLAASARGEFYMDKDQVIIATGTENGFQTTGYSLNLDYRIRSNAVWRIEGRTMQSKDEIFLKKDQFVKVNTFVTTSVAISF